MKDRAHREVRTKVEWTFVYPFKLKMLGEVDGETINCTAIISDSTSLFRGFRAREFICAHGRLWSSPTTGICLHGLSGFLNH
jgi:hypothetical protein